jgi:hypothetical protein
VIIALGEKVFGALLVIAGAAIILTDAGVWRFGVIDVELSTVTAAPVRRGDRGLLHRAQRQRSGAHLRLRPRKMGPGAL